MSSAGEKLALTAVAAMIAGCPSAPPPDPATPVSIPPGEAVVLIPPPGADTGDPVEPEPEERRAWRPFKPRRAPPGNCCRGMNECKGKGNCKVDETHDCKGRNECKGKGGCRSVDCVSDQ
jgi:hypothetical protein